MDSVGVFLWANRAQYAEVSFQTVSDDSLADTKLPTMREDIDEDGLSIFPSIPSVSSPASPFLVVFFEPSTGAES